MEVAGHHAHVHHQPFGGFSLGQLFSTHPSTADRIARLQAMPVRMIEVASTVSRGPLASGHPWIFEHVVQLRASSGTPNQSGRSRGRALRGRTLQQFLISCVCYRARSNRPRLSSESLRRQPSPGRGARHRAYRLVHASPCPDCGPLCGLRDADPRPGHGFGARHVTSCLEELLTYSDRGPQ